jgi:protein-tyrosine phosphatase
MEILAINDEGTLYVSGLIDDWAQVRALRIDTIVDMDGDVDPGVPEAPNQILYVYYPIADEQLPCAPKLHAVGRLVADLVRQRHVALVHCRLGLNRSNLLLGTALTYLGMSGAQALERLRRVQPAALFNDTFADYLRSLPAGGVP